jgi:hypothetical protein
MVTRGEEGNKLDGACQDNVVSKVGSNFPQGKLHPVVI